MSIWPWSKFKTLRDERDRAKKLAERAAQRVVELGDAYDEQCAKMRHAAISAAQAAHLTQVLNVPDQRPYWCLPTPPKALSVYSPFDPTMDDLVCETRQLKMRKIGWQCYLAVDLFDTPDRMEAVLMCELIRHAGEAVRLFVQEDAKDGEVPER